MRILFICLLFLGLISCKTTRINLDDLSKDSHKVLSHLKDSGILKNVDNKVVFLNFWFEGCGPCIAEFPAMESLYNNYKQDSNFVFVAFTFETEEVINRMKQKHNVSFPMETLNKSLIRYMQVISYPTNLIFNKKGVLIKKQIGGSLETKRVNSLFNYEIIPVINSALKK